MLGVTLQSFYDMDVDDLQWEVFKDEVTAEIVKNVRNAESGDSGTFANVVEWEGTIRDTGVIKFLFYLNWADDIQYVDELFGTIPYDAVFTQPYDFQVGFDSDNLEQAISKTESSWDVVDDDDVNSRIIAEDNGEIVLPDIKSHITLGAVAAFMGQRITDVISETREKAFNTQDDLWMR